VSAIETVLADAAKDMAQAGEKAGESISKHLESIGTTLEHSGSRYKSTESDIEKSFSDVGKGGAQSAEKAAGQIGKNTAKTLPKDAKSVSNDAEQTAAKNVSTEASEDTKLSHEHTDPATDAKTPGCQGASGDPVDLVSGEMFLPQRDVQLDGILALILERMHRSGYRHGLLFGRTWASTLDQRIEIDDDGVHYAAPDGTILHYQVPTQPGQRVQPSAGARWPLSHDRETDTYRIEKPESGQSLHFAATPERGAMRRLSSVKDRNGNRITLVHDVDGMPTDVYHSGGYHIEVRSTLTREGARIGEYLLADPHGGSSTSLARFEYDMAGRLTGVYNSSGLPMRFEYDDADRLTAWIDRNGYRYEYAYDPETGRVTRSVGAEGLLTADFEYDPAGRQTVLIDSTGQRTTYRYNELGQVFEVVDALGGSVRNEQDAHSHLLSRTDELGRTMRISWNEDGDPVRVEHPDGTATHVEYSAPRQAARVTLPSGGVWHYEYDERGNLLAATDPAGATTRYTYDEHGALASLHEPAGGVRRWANDGHGLPVAVTDAHGETTRITRDAFGRPTAVTDPLGRTHTAEWTVEGRPARRGLPDGSYESYTYDAEGNLLEFRDPAGFLTEFEYGGFDVVTARVDPDGARYGFEYDTQLRAVRVLGPTGRDWRYTYDARGKLVGERDFDGREVSYRLDAAGQLVERSTDGGESVRYRHDPRGRIVGRSVGTAEYNYAFDADGMLTRAEGPDGVLEYTRDPMGRVLTEAFDGRVSGYAYDPAGRVVGRTTATGAASAWEYDIAGRAARLGAGPGGLEIQRDAAGRETSRILGPDAALSQSYDAIGQLNAQAIWVRDVQAADGTGFRNVQARTYAYRADGFPLEVGDLLGGDTRYELDQLGRVTEVRAATWRETYAYDPMGNLTAAAVPDAAAPAGAADGAQASAVPSAEPFEHEGVRIRRAGRTHYEHDARGRVVRRTRRTLSGQTREWTYAWDDEDQLREVHTPEGATWRYRYDPLGRRVAKQRVAADGAVAEEIVYSWEGARIAEQATRRPDGTVTALTWDYEPGSFTPAAQRRRTWVDGASAAEIDEEFYAIVADRVGTPRELVAPEGRVVWRQSGSVWGAPLGAATAGDPAAAVDCPLRFPGQYYDEETGWHYNLHRYYNPETACYVSPDPLGLAPGPNPFGYIDNPLAASDPLGLAPEGCRPGAENNPVYQQALALADHAYAQPGKKPGMAEVIQTQSGGMYGATSGSDVPNLHPTVQSVLDGATVQGRGHGKCGLPRALTEALNSGDDPNGATAAAVFVRAPANAAHGKGAGPCASCANLRTHFNLNFITKWPEEP
jgi:RHS repeat-associated protein